MNSMFANAVPAGPAGELVAYFCAEYAVDERLPIYSGGLGVLAGDHLKTASDMGIPLVAVGLLYHEGYFTQRIDGHGQQHADPTHFDYDEAGLTPVIDALGHELRISIPMADHVVALRVWRKEVGSVPLLLLDANVEENGHDDRGITARLYGTGHDMRLRQEMVLGIGGVRAIRAVGLRPHVWHINEGHAALMILERMREWIAFGYTFDAALETVAACTAFTTHTPVPAGHDVFNQGQIRHWLGQYASALHTTERRLLDLGSESGDLNSFNMTTLALRGSRYRNAVSRLHRSVAAEMEQATWPDVPAADNPIGYVTNGVHLPTFLAAPWQSLLDMHCEDWRERRLDMDRLAFIDGIADAELLQLRHQLRDRLLDDVRVRLRTQHLRTGTAPDTIDALLARLDEVGGRACIIGFARRYATYKRATLLLRDTERLATLMSDTDRPVILMFAGKAHPADGGGQNLIRQLYAHAMQPEFLGRLIVLEGYDIDLARKLVQGCDVWLNTPEYPMEASGTSGMKSAINGGVNLSVLDGWWAEGYDEHNGFAIDPVHDSSAEVRDAAECAQLYRLLEERVLPEYFADDGASPSAAWLRRVRHSMRSVISGFASTRMLADYLERVYLPAAELGHHVNAAAGKVATNLSRWKRLVRQRWPEVRIDAFEPAADGWTVHVAGAGLPSRQLRVEAVTADGICTPLRPDATGDQRLRYVLDAATGDVVEFRLVPVHELLPHPYEMGLMIRVPVS